MPAGTLRVRKSGGKVRLGMTEGIARLVIGVPSKLSVFKALRLEGTMRFVSEACDRSRDVNFVRLRGMAKAVCLVKERFRKDRLVRVPKKAKFVVKLPIRFKDVMCERSPLRLNFESLPKPKSKARKSERFGGRVRLDSELLSSTNSVR